MEAPLKVAQTAAIMEVVHSGVGLVRSPVFITGAGACLLGSERCCTADVGSTWAA